MRTVADPKTTSRLGIAFAVVSTAAWGFGVAGLPESYPPTSDELVEYYTDHAGTVMVSAVLTGFAVALLVWFLARLRPTLRHAEGSDGHVTDVAIGGGLVAAAMMLASASARFAPAIRAEDQDALDPAVATALGDLHLQLSGAAAPVAFGVLVAATAAIGFRHRALPRWLCWVSAVLAAGLLLPIAPWAVIMVFPLWVVALCVAIRHPRTADAAPTETGEALARPA